MYIQLKNIPNFYSTKLSEFTIPLIHFASRWMKSGLYIFLYVIFAQVYASESGHTVPAQDLPLRNILNVAKVTTGISW